MSPKNCAARRRTASNSTLSDVGGSPQHRAEAMSTSAGALVVATHPTSAVPRQRPPAAALLWTSGNARRSQCERRVRGGYAACAGRPTRHHRLLAERPIRRREMVRRAARARRRRGRVDLPRERLDIPGAAAARPGRSAALGPLRHRGRVGVELGLAGAAGPGASAVGASVRRPLPHSVAAPRLHERCRPRVDQLHVRGAAVVVCRQARGRRLPRDGLVPHLRALAAVGAVHGARPRPVVPRTDECDAHRRRRRRPRAADSEGAVGPRALRRDRLRAGARALPRAHA